MDPHDAPFDPKRQSTAVAQNIIMFLQSLSVLCGEHFITHEQHQRWTTELDQAGKVWLENKEVLKGLDFEP